MRALLFTLLIFMSLYSFSQTNDERVSLIEDKQRKRTLLFVQNNTDKDLNVFLKVDGKGYRRSSDRPIIKDIPANSKVLMKTLIPLTDEPSSYSHILVVNDREQPIDVSIRKDAPEVADFENLLNNDLVVFTKDGCPRCVIMLNILRDQHTPYKEVNIDDRKRYYDALYVLLKKEQDKNYSVKLPIVRKRGDLIYPIWNVKKMARDLGNEFKTH